VSEYRLERLEPVGVGAAARFRLREGKLWMNSVIDVAERPHLVREHGRGGRGNRLAIFTVWELAEGPSPESSEVTVTFWTEPATLFDRVGDALRSHRRLRRDFKRTLARLRQLAEHGGSPEPVEVAGGDRLPAFSR
jgi:hypothetical protein